MGGEIDGWTLNVSRGGVRIIVEESFQPGEEIEIRLNPQDEVPEVHRARVAWLREQPDGQIVGVQYLDVEGTVPPPAEGEPA